MVEQYKLRLGDGTVLAVDEQGLRAWLVDAKAMVQRPGSQAWRPLKEILVALARESAAAAAAAATAAKSPAPAPTPAVPLAAQPPVQRPVPPPAAPAGRVTTSPLAEPIAKGGAKLDDGIPIIPFKRLDDDESLRPAIAPSGDLRDVAAAALDPGGRNDAPWQWPAAQARADVAPAAPPPDPPPAVARSSTRSAQVPVRQGPVDPRSIVYPPVPGEVAVRAAVKWGASLLSLGRKQLARLPPPSALPPLDQALASPAARRVKRGLVLAVSLAAVVVAGLSLWAWWPRTREGDSRSAGQGATLPPPVSVAAPVPELPKEVQEAIAQLPHLGPETIQLVMASGDAPVTDPPVVFRRAYIAVDRGTSALTDDEAKELRSLMNGVLGSLRRVDRERVRAYGRLSSQRDLLVEEDRKVLSLFARGVRALPPARRERLQELSGKAVAAGLPTRPPLPGTAVP